MGILSDFFISDASSVPVYEVGESFAEEDKCQFKSLTPLQAAQFLAVLRGRESEDAASMIGEFRLITPEDADDWTMTVPDDMVAALSGIVGGKIPELAARFSEVTREELDWSPEDFVPIVSSLAVLARRAIAAQKKMYLWVCL